MPRTQDQPLEHKIMPFEVKEVDLDASTFTGYSAAMGNEDLGRDVIKPGAFNKTIRERVARRYIKLLDNHQARSTQNVWGTVVDAEEVPFKGRGDNAPTHKLLTTFEVSEADPHAQVALRKVSERHLDQLSIGFRPLKMEYEVDEGKEDQADDPYWAWIMGDGTRIIKEIQWWETSLVIWAMNPEAQVLMGSVDALMRFAEKAAQSGVSVPEGAVMDTIRALQQLVPGSAGAGTEVHRAVADVQSVLKTLESTNTPTDAVDRLSDLAASYYKEHGEDEDLGSQHFVSWVVDHVPEPEDALSADDPEETKTADDVADDDPDVVVAEDEDSEADNVVEQKEDEETPEGDEPAAESDADLVSAVHTLRGVVDKLAETLGAGALETDDETPDETVTVTDDHAEDVPEAAKDTDPEEDGRNEHFPDGDELALTLESLEILKVQATAVQHKTNP